MKILLEQSKVKESALKRILTKYVAKELGNLSEPCYYPQMKKYHYELMHTTGLTEQDLKAFTKRFYGDHPAAKANLVQDTGTNLQVFIMYYFLLKRDVNMFHMAIAYHMIRQYANLMYKTFKYCNADVFRYALDHIAKTHLFSREKTIPNSLYFLSKELVRKHEKGIRKPDSDEIIKFIIESRHRISQSLKSFAELYYRAAEEGLATKQYDEETDTAGIDMAKSERVVAEILKKLFTHKVFDQLALDDGTKLTKVNKKLSEQIARKLNDIKYSDNVKICLDLFMKDLKDVKSICGNEFFSYVKRLMAVKRTNQRVYFKQQVQILTVKLIDDIDYREKYDSLSSQSQFLISLFVALYITLYTRHMLCGKKQVNYSQIKNIWGW